ncbi:MAG TPA: translation initiation factor IF-6 [Nitrososphaerales archaeon]|nr:translation initiation factor IF-6 [Nitrososphaerales archaeon]
MGLYLVDLYRSPNIGIFLKANDSTVLVPKGIASTKMEKLASSLEVVACPTSIGETRLLGPLIAMNNKGIIASRMMEDYEMEEISSSTGLKVARLQSRFTAVGNLVAANDNGAVVSPVLEHHAVEQIEAALGVKAHTMTIGDFSQVGAMIVATNSGAAVSPRASEEEGEAIGRILKVDVSASSVNGGIPFPASGVVANAKDAVAGNLTSGPELVFLTRALKV